MNEKITLELDNGINGCVNASIDLKIGKVISFTSALGYVYKVQCVEVSKNFNRQCYKCFFCHNIEGCGMMQCSLERRADKKYVKFKEIKEDKQ